MTIIRVRYVPPGSDDPVAGWIRFVPRSFDPNSPIAEGPDVLVGDTGQIEIEPGMNTIEVRPTSSGWFYAVQGRAGRHSFSTNVLVPPSGEHDFESLVRVDPKAGGLEYEPDPEWRADLDSIRHMGGVPGPDGADAYQVAVREGYTGSEEEWLESLVGPEGEPGEPGITDLASRDAAGLMSAEDKAKSDDLMTADQNPQGDWVFGRGWTGEEDRAKLAVERVYDTTQGDLYDSTSRLEISMRDQSDTTQTPPGYTIGSISLVEDGDNHSQFQGESARFDLVSNRFRFNKRLEVNQGGYSRAVLSSGLNRNQQFARLGLHNVHEPNVTLYGAENEHGGKKSVLQTTEANIEVNHTGTRGQEWNTTDNNGAQQSVQINQLDAGGQTFEAHYDGDLVGRFFFNWTGDIIFRPGRNLVIEAPTTVNNDIRFTASGTGPVLTSPNGTQHRVTVDDNGNLSNTGIDVDTNVGTKVTVAGQVVFYDSGWRDFSEYLSSELLGGSFYVRRTLTDLYYSFSDIEMPEGTGFQRVASLIPVEWRPRDTRNGFVISRNNNSSYREYMGTLPSGIINWIGEGFPQGGEPPSGVRPSAGITGSWTFASRTDLPTSLPGTAV